MKQPDPGQPTVDHSLLRLREMRREAGMTLRDLARKCGIAPGYLSNLERGSNSPTLATLRRILSALGTDLEAFFANGAEPPASRYAFRRETMKTVSDAKRHYTFLFPRSPDVKAEVLDEYMKPGEAVAEFEVLECDVGGLVLEGLLELEIRGEPREMLRAGDAFYVPAGATHRGRCLSAEPVHLVTFYVPPKY